MIRAIFVFLVSMLLFLESKANNTDTCNFDTETEFKAVLRQFVDSVKSNSILDGRFDIYIAKFQYGDSAKKYMNFSVGYLCNSREFRTFKAGYYFHFGDEIVLCNLSDAKAVSLLNNLNIKKINAYQDTAQIRIVQKMYPSDMGHISHPLSEMVYMQNKCVKTVTYYFDGNNKAVGMESVYGKLPDIKPIRVYPKFPKTGK